MARDRFLARAAAALLLGAALAAAGCGKSTEERLAEAKELQEKQQFEASLEPLRAVLAEEPGHPEASLRLGIALAKTGQLSGSVFPLRQAAEDETFAVDAGLMLAQVMLATGNADQAHAAVTRVLERNPDHVEALALRIQTGHGRGDYEAVLVDAERLSKLEPGPRGLSMRVAALESLRRFEEERAVLQELEALHREQGDLAEAARACGVRAASFEKSDGNLERAIPAIEACLAEYPTQQVVLETATQVLPAERSLGLWKRASEEAPESLELRVGYSMQLLAAGRRDEALAEMRGAAEDFRTVQVWVSLADLEATMGLADEADASLQKAAAAAPQQAATILLRRADLRIANGDLDGAEKLAGEIEDPALANVIRAHILLEKADFQASLELAEKALESYPSHAGARTIAGRAAERLGQNERALAHYREAVRVDAGGTSAGYFAGLLATSLGRHPEAAEYLVRHLTSMKTPPDARLYSAAIRATQMAGMSQVTIELLERMSQRPDLAAALAIEKAWLAGQAGGLEATARALAASDVDLADPANETALRTLVDAELALGQGNEALGRIDAALRRSPDRASLLDARGRALLQLGRSDEAKADFQRATEIAPGYGPAKAGLGAVAAQAGDLELALRLYDEASTASSPDPEAQYRAAQAAQALGRTDEAEQRYRVMLADQPDHVGSNNDLAWVLAEQKKDLDGALVFAQRAVSLAPTPNSWDTLAFVQMQRGDGAAALQTLESALEKNPGQPTLLYRLGLARKASGDTKGAANAFRQALDAGAFPEVEAARAELASLERSNQP